MEYLKSPAYEKTDHVTVERILDNSLKENDPHCRKSLQELIDLGLEREKALALLAHHRSFAKYGYTLSSNTIEHLFNLSKTKEERSACLKRLLDSPFLLAKTCWLYEHAPYFFYFEEDKQENIDSLIFEFAEEYETFFLNSRVATDTWEKVINPKRVMATTFWERKIIDPVLLIEKAMTDMIEGIELNFDFHPFNYSKLLPEDITAEKRKEIKEAVKRSGVKIDIHSPIIGPYAPSPDPSKGKQLFFNPTECLAVQFETVDLAKDIGAGCVTLHLIDPTDVKPMLKLIEKAAGSDVRVSIENYCQTKHRQTSDVFIAFLEEILNALPKEIREKNFGVTLDVGHLNIEGEDPLVAAEIIGKWCLQTGVYLRVHATDNYGDLLFSPPAYSADVHGNVSGRGINNALIIKLLRSLGHEFRVVAEQIKPLTSQDITTIHDAQTFPLSKSYEAYCNEGKERLAAENMGVFIEPEIAEIEPYQFLVGIEGVSALTEYLLYRKIQGNKSLSVDEARKISRDFIRMPQKIRSDLTEYIDDFLSLIQTESGHIKKSDIDLVCQNISGALFGAISNEHLDQIFSKERIYSKGDIICQQKKSGREMYYIKKGEVIVYIDGSCVASLGPGEIFGEISLFYNIDRSATIVTLTEGTVVGILTRGGLENLFKGRKHYARDLIYRFFNILPDRLRNLNDKYKTAIRALHLIFDGNEKSLPRIDTRGIKPIKNELDFLPTLSENETKKIFREISEVDSEQKIFSEGDKGLGAYYIIEGKVKVSTFSPDSKEILLGELGEGEIFGEMALIDEKPRSATVVSTTPCKLALIHKKEFNILTEERSELAYHMMGFICLSLFRSILRLDRLYSEIKRKIYRPDR